VTPQDKDKDKSMVFVKIYLSSDMELRTKLGRETLSLQSIYVKRKKSVKDKHILSVDRSGDDSSRVSEVRLKYHSKKRTRIF